MSKENEMLAAIVEDIKLPANDPFAEKDFKLSEALISHGMCGEWWQVERLLDAMNAAELRAYLMRSTQRMIAIIRDGTTGVAL